MKSIEYFVNSLKGVRSQSDFHRFIDAISGNEAFQWVGIVTYKTVSLSQTDVNVVGSVPQELHPWLHTNRELMKLSRTNVVPQSISATSIDGADGVRDLGGILLVPFAGLTNEHGFLLLAMDTQAFQQDSEKCEKLGWYWSIIVPYLFEAYCRVFNTEVAKMTKREKECICWASEGKTSWEISKILDITERTVNFHLANCIQKTGSVNRQQAIAKCLLQGDLISA